MRDPMGGSKVAALAFVAWVVLVVSWVWGGSGNDVRAQSTGSVTNVQVTGLATIMLATAVDSTGAVTAVTTDYVDVARCVAVFSAVDNANDADIEGTVDGTVWHLIDTADPNTPNASFLLDDTSGPWSSMRANVIALGAGVDVTVTCLATMRR
ncbi:hypothetical protein LCGC14_1102050 [marine sediment metagenome]|uniref:Uncharacterized protein n=2 Tax=root TaxID=1 RepID=A0A9C9NDM0_9HYPH|nr:hypothetical protein [Aurantimonas coralicida]